MQYYNCILNFFYFLIPYITPIIFTKWTVFVLIQSGIFKDLSDVKAINAYAVSCIFIIICELVLEELVA